LTEKEAFKQACFDGFASLKGFSDQQLEDWKSKWTLSTSCRKCSKPVTKEDFHVVVGYWTPLWFSAHKDCISIQAEDAYDCQKIDADCNDCGHFVRGEKLSCPGSKYASFKGHCSKWDFKTMGHVNFCTDMPCFEHRKDLAEALA